MKKDLDIRIFLLILLVVLFIIVLIILVLSIFSMIKSPEANPNEVIDANVLKQSYIIGNKALFNIIVFSIIEIILALGIYFNYKKLKKSEEKI